MNKKLLIIVIIVILLLLKKKAKAMDNKKINNGEHLALAKSQIGVKEVGKNGGKDVLKYLNSVGLGGGHSWCMAFVYWCCKNSLVNNPLLKTGHVKTQFNAMKAKGITGNKPRIGAIFCMSRPSNVPDSGHTGIVTSFDDKYIYTIEGNIFLNGFEGVHTNKRLINTIDWGFIYV